MCSRLGPVAIATAPDGICVFVCNISTLIYIKASQAYEINVQCTHTHNQSLESIWMQKMSVQHMCRHSMRKTCRLLERKEKQLYEARLIAFTLHMHVFELCQPLSCSKSISFFLSLFFLLEVCFRHTAPDKHSRHVHPISYAYAVWSVRENDEWYCCIFYHHKSVMHFSC